MKEDNVESKTRLPRWFNGVSVILKNLRRGGLAIFSRSNLARNIFRNYATRGSLLSIKND